MSSPRLFSGGEASDELHRLKLELETLAPVPRSLMITGVSGGEGCTSLAASLALSMLHPPPPRGVVVVDANLLRPALHEVFGVSLEEGLLDWSGHGPLRFRSASGSVGLSTLSAGRRTHKALSSAQSALFRGALDQARASFDIVILDSAPVTQAPETAYLGSLVDGILIVVEWDRTKIDALAFVKEKLERAGGRVVGAVLNRSGRFLPRLPRLPWRNKFAD